MNRTSWLAIIALGVAAHVALGLGCRSASSSHPKPASYEYRFGMDLPEWAFLVLRQGAVEERVFDENGVRRAEISSDRWLSDGSASLLVRLHSPCGTKDLPVRFKDLDQAKERELRASDERDRTQIHVAGELAAPLAHPKALVWVDWNDADPAKGNVLIGSLDLASVQTDRRRPVYALFDLGCAEGRTVRIAGAVAGKLDLTPHDDSPEPLYLDSEIYLVSTRPQQCYRTTSLSYGSTPGTGTMTDHLPGTPAIHPLPDRDIDYFLELAPASAETTAYSPAHTSRVELVREPCGKATR